MVRRRRIEAAQRAVSLVVLLLSCSVLAVQPALGSSRGSRRAPIRVLPVQPAPKATSLAPSQGGEPGGARNGPRGNVEDPFGELSVASNGTVYYVDREHGQIDELTASEDRTVLSSLDGTDAPNGSIAGLSGLSVTAKAIWFTAGDGLYQASLSGRTVRREGSVTGAVDIDVLADGAAFVTTATAIFERSTGAVIERVAGGSSIDFVAQQAGPQRAVDEAIYPAGVVGVSPQTFYFTNENNLYLVHNGIATMLNPRFRFFNGELATRPGSSIYGICDWWVCRISGHGFMKLFKFPEPVNGAFAAPDAFAVSPSGSFYISYSDQSSQAKAGIVELSPIGKVVAVLASQT